MAPFVIENSPNKKVVFTNFVYLDAGDFARLKARSPEQGTGDKLMLVLLRCASGDWVFTAAPYAGIVSGTLAVSGAQRTTASLELGTQVEVEPFLPTANMPLAKLKFKVDMVDKDKTVDIDAAELAAYFQREYNCQVFAVGQKCLIFKSKVVLEVFVESVTFSAMATGAAPRFGQLIPPTEVTFEKKEGGKAGLRLKNSAPGGGAARVDLFNSDFDFGKLGIGGLSEQFNTIFRRAFASRIYPSHIIEQMGISHIRGMLLFGPPGCGKTLIARQIGKVLNAREPKIVNGPEVLDKYVGASEQKIRDLFADAEKEQKDRGDDSMLHIIIFDEMDAICKSRGSVKDGTGVSDSIVNQLLSKIDGVDSLNNILIIGMTNRKDMIDEAILRPGRLELHVEIGLPDEAGRLQILKIKTAAMRESGRLEAAAADALPYFAAKTKNFSGAELEGLVKSAASYALRRCCDVSKDMTLDEASLVIKKADLDYAIESGDVVPRLGVQLEDLELLYRNGIVDYGPAFADMKASLDRLVDQVRTSPRTPLMTVLLEGAAATGKTALAAATAVASQFPFIRILAADSMIGYSESSKCTTIQKFFLDSYKSPLSILVIDDIERLIEYTPIGPRFSNPVLQTLLVLLKKAPPEADRRLMVIATTGSARSLEDLELVEAFNVSIHVPKLSAPAEIQAVLRELAVADADVAQISAAVTKPMGVKQLLMITEMARGENDAVNVNDFMDCLHTVIH